MNLSNIKLRFIHVHGTPHAPNWDRSETLKLLADTDKIAGINSDTDSPLGRPDDPPRKISYSAGYRQDRETARTFITFMNDTAHQPVATITFAGRPINVQVVQLPWFDYFQYDDVKQQAQVTVNDALSADIPLGLLVDVTIPRKYAIVSRAYMRDGELFANIRTLLDIPDKNRKWFKQPADDDVLVFLDILGLDCPFAVIDRDQPDTVRGIFDDLVGRVSSTG